MTLTRERGPGGNEVARSRGTAVVCGASIAGLLAARVLSDFYENVTVVERDVLPNAAAQRRGVAHGRHLHMLLARGTSEFSELLPGLLDDLADDGAQVLDGSDPSLFYLQVGERVMRVAGTFTRPDELVILLASRPLLEAHVRRRVRAIANLTVLDGHDAIGPVIESYDRVSGVQVVNRRTGQEHVLEADLVVDATGRSPRMPALLSAHGYQRPKEHKYKVNLSYSSQFFRVPAGTLTEKVVVVNRPLQKPYGAGLFAYEAGTSILTLIGLGGHKPPTDLPGVLAAATELLPSRISGALHVATPLGEASGQHYPASIWRRYDKLDRFPEGLLVVGDAVCSLNPVWGQGMTSAAFQARTLRECLSTGTDGLWRRYFHSVAKDLAPIWRNNRLLDFTVAPAEDWRATPKRLLNWHTNKVWAAAESDIVVTETAMRMMELLDPPAIWLKPKMLRLIIANQSNASHTTDINPSNSSMR